MKKDIHPKYEDATITCACGNVIHTRSTVKAMTPYYTGKKTVMDTEGRIDKFMQRYGKK